MRSTRISGRTTNFLCWGVAGWLWTAVAAYGGAPPSASKPITNSSAASPWANMVMIGASASAGFTAAEPLGGPTTSQYRLNRYLDAAVKVPHEPVRNVANTLFFMQPEVEGKRQVALALESHPTLALGADFLFWFCYGEGANDSERLRRFETGLKLCEAFSCPLVLGDIPDASAALNGMLSPEEMPSRSAISAANRRLKAWAAAHSNVVVMSLSNFMAMAAADRATSIHGHSLPQGGTGILLQADKLHPSPPGCAVLALLMLDAFQATRPPNTEAEIIWDPKAVFRLVYSPPPPPASSAAKPKAAPPAQSSGK